MDDLQAPVRVLFVEQKSGQALMKKQGFMPIDALTLRHPTTKQLMQGYELPTDQLQPLLATLDKRSITYEQPNTSSFSTSYTTSLPERLAQWHPDALEARTIGHFIGTFLDISGTATARATFYNTAE
ncbi:MAG TPA: hypothetical protein DCE42_26810, partial [Myxococcales bacterium]|nr:hypothetical protein [Myxococcales bacterium]